MAVRQKSTPRYAAALMACVLTGSVSACGLSQGPSSPERVIGQSDDSKVPFAGEENSTPQQKLMTVLSRDGQYGVVVGRITDGGSSMLSDKGDPESIFTSYQFEITDTRGAKSKLFEGSIIELVTPGGQIGDVRVEDDGAPSFSKGDRVAIFAQFESQRKTAAGKNTKRRLVVESSDNVARVVGDRATWLGWDTSLESFLAVLDKYSSPRDPEMSSRAD